MSAPDLKSLTLAMQTGDYQAMAKAMGFTLDSDTAKMLDRMGELERLNDELVKKVAHLREQIWEHRALLSEILKSGESNCWASEMDQLLQKYGD